MKQNKQPNYTKKEVDSENIGMRSDLDAEHPLKTVDRYAGDSLEEHKQLEEANEYLGEKITKQVFNNS
ncbi:hypothetical protein [Radiobacillus sp. PE A8.2]|uniref:hypothetical protein n=1 Tax=Radiobacillus sp. PE A8.2 TaxID=3380349 RepID=UPI00388E853C